MHHHGNPGHVRPDFDQLVGELSADVWLLCRHLGDQQSAEDLTQETFLRAYKSLPRYRGDASPRTWVFSIARRVCADHVQRAQRDRALIKRVELDAASPHTSRDNTSELALWDLVDGLEPDRRAAFVLTQIFGLPYAEAAEICACPVGTIRSRVARSRSDLIQALPEHAAKAAARRTGTK